jgi:predicted ATPase
MRQPDIGAISTAFNFEAAGYQVIEKLSHQGKVVVYRAKVIYPRSSRTTDTVVIKLLSSTDATYQELVNFRNQYTIVKQINLPGVVQVYSLEDFEADVDGLPLRGYALVMEDFGGVSLNRYAREQILELGEVLEIAIQLADTLHSLGQQRILHKDIKPSNILINPTTKQVKIIDFGIASLLPKETLETRNLNGLEGTLAYIAPEQTGRMNRGIDYRCDFYSLGVTLYELFTGKLPFQAEDTLGWVYCHLAHIAVLAHRVNPNVPKSIAQILAKLMAKNAEDRYQSALGIKFDLKECLRQWQATGTITAFEIAQGDYSSRFTIPERLYGREVEIQTLATAFDQVAAGSSKLMLVAGSAGVGKTAVINEIHKSIVRQRGYFIKGKYDQLNRNIPFSGFIQAFRSLIDQLFSESNSQLADWKSQILAAVGKNGRVLLEVIPELVQIIGAQPPVAELVGMAEQNRFNLLLQKFVGIFAKAEHPLTIFLDDLQWADSASLKSINLLLSGTEYLLLLGAYRDNEVPQFHPLMLTLQQLQKTDAIINTILLAPLAVEDTNRLIADTLHCDLDTAKPLTNSIDLKTQGNPFFTTQFLKALYEDGEITFNSDGYWECDLARIQSLSITDDVVEFMAEQLEKLPSETQEVIKLAACIGDRFDLDTLKTVSKQSHLHTATALWQGLQSGLILPTSQIYKFFQPQHSQEIELDDSSGSPNPGELIAAAKSQGSIGELSLEWKLNTSFSFDPNSTYRFLHDRVQQAAYSLIPQHQKRHIHLQIARLLSANTPNLYQSDRLLEIVNHYNLAMDLQPDMKIDLMDELAERQHLAKLNLLAAQKARASTAYAAAFNYAQIGAKILGTIGWQTAYQLTLSLHEILAEAAFLNGDLAIVSVWTQVVLDRVQKPLDRVKTYETIIQFHLLQKQYQQAIDRGLEILRQLGVKLSAQPSKLILVGELAKIKIGIWGKSNQDLLAIPETLDPVHTAPLKILDSLMTPSFFVSEELMVVLATTGIHLTLRHGNTPWAASFYQTYSIILASLEELKQSYQIGQIANVLSDRYGNLAITAKIKTAWPWFSQLWQEDFRAGIPIVDESIMAAIESGNLTFAGIGAYTSILIRFYAGVSLDEIADRILEIEDIIVRSKDESSQQLFRIESQKIANLRQTSSRPYQVFGSDLDEQVEIAKWQQNGEVSSLCSVYGVKTILAYTFEDMTTALSYTDALLAYPVSGITKASIFDALIRLAVYPHSSDRVKTQLLKQVLNTQHQLAKRAKLMPGNFQHKYDLVTAEKCRVLGNFTTAMELYDQAIMGARKYKYLHEEAIANECAAKFYRAWGKENIATTYMQSAYYCYARWGSKAKTNDLEQRYPELLRLADS